MVEQIEEVHAELDAYAFTPYAPVFINGEVSVDVARTMTVAHRFNIVRNGSELIADECKGTRVDDLGAASSLCATLAWIDQGPVVIGITGADQRTHAAVGAANGQSGVFRYAVLIHRSRRA